MKQEIKHRFTGEILFALETDSMRLCIEAAIKSGANLSGADLSGADLYGVNLYGVDLSGADLYGADLYGANLYRANLSGADLYRANLSGANLYRANGVDLNRVVALRILLDQPGKIRAYKLVNEHNVGPFNGGLEYRVGRVVSVKNANIDANEQCAAGINVATLDWCIREWHNGFKILLVEFTAKDIAAIPLGTDGKFRLHRCKVVKRLNPKEYGLDETWNIPKVEAQP